MNCYLNIYVGTPENEHEDFLFLDLVVGPYEIEVDRSSSSLDGMTGDDFLDTLGDLLNTASLFSSQLKLEIKLDVDELFTDIDDMCISERCEKNIRALIKEVLE